MAAPERIRQLVQKYEQLAALSAQMHETARQAQWEQLVSLEQTRGDVLALIKLLDVEATLDAASRQQKIELILKIQADDAETRKLAQAWMGELQSIMNSVHLEQRLKEAYGD